MKIPNNAPPPAHALFWIFFGFFLDFFWIFFGFCLVLVLVFTKKKKKKWAGGFEEAKNFIVEREKK